MKKTYNLTVYLSVERFVAIPIAESTFDDYDEMLKYCATFLTHECYIDDGWEFLFDVWTDEDGQFNIDNEVEELKAAIQLESLSR